MISNYLKEKSKYIGIIILIIFVFAGINYLYNMNLEPILYGSFLSIFLSTGVFIYDFIKYKNKMENLKSIEGNIENIIETEKNSISELFYKDIIKKLYEENLSIRTENDKNKREINDYYSLWVHQVKTPISSMNLILKNLEIEEKGELIGELFKIEEYVNMALGYVRLNEGESDLVLNECDLDTILKASIKKYSRLFIRKNLKLNYGDINYRLITDEKWLAFGIEQILSNSIKYTKKGSVSIYMEKDKLYIEDTGIGIDSQDINRIFDKGFTGYNGREDKKATGLGLYLAKKTFENLGYKIKIESKIDEFTRVIITLNKDKIVEY